MLGRLSVRSTAFGMREHQFRSPRGTRRAGRDSVAQPNWEIESAIALRLDIGRIGAIVSRGWFVHENRQFFSLHLACRARWFLRQKGKPMTTPRTLRLGGIFSATILSLVSLSHAQTFFSDSLDSAAGWTVNSSGTSDQAIFGFNYSSVGIPAAPNSGGTTSGLLLQANRSAGVQSGISVSPTGQSFSGDYQLRFDLWQNYNGPLGPTAVGGSGSTQISGGGIGTAGTTPQWAGAVYDSIFFGATGDGGSSIDYRVYAKANTAPATSGFYAAGTSTTPDSRNNADPYYANFGGQAAPAEQAALFPQQTGTTQAGAQAFAWRDVAITKIGNTVTWDIDGKRIATVDASAITLGGGNILLNYYDINAGSSTDPNAGSLLFGLFDNVRVTAVPEPSTYALLGLGALFLAARRRK